MKTFEELFQGAKALNWGDIIPVDGKFTVIGKSVKFTQGLARAYNYT